MAAVIKPEVQYKKEDEVELLCEFLKNFKDPQGTSKYLDSLQKVANGGKVLEVYLDDVVQYFNDGGLMAKRIQRNTLRYQGIAAIASDRCMPLPDVDNIESGSVFDIYTSTRKTLISDAREQGISVSAVPLQLLQSHVVHFLPCTSPGKTTAESIPLRRCGAEHIGSLVTIRGLVVKVSDVQPTVQVQTYLCNICQYESYQTVEQHNSFSPLTQCPSPQCVQNQSKGDLRVQLRSSKLVPQQIIILQELQQEVPVGGVARTMKLVCNSPDLVRVAKPGALVTASGIYLPEQFTGFRGLTQGLLTEPYLLVKMLALSKKNYNEVIITDEMLQHLNELSQRADIYQLLTDYISPEIYGHGDTKRALLLSMIGGVTRTMPDGMRIRGDINLMLVGDPGMAKSQIIKYVHGLAPRSIYTTGKGASGVGLTASVQRDVKTGEISLEGGALVLADMGICCIDEFDKMTEEDRTAIHEVMEQQTVSISKAGIITSLNARTTVIAAANPAFGRYNPKRSLSENMNMPPALLSRFDLVFVLLDIPSEDRDKELARHITYVHKNKRPPALPSPDSAHSAEDIGLNNDVFRAYIAKAKSFAPTIPAHVMKHISQSYVNMRQSTSSEDAFSSSSNSTGNSRERFCTARLLLGIIRISQALAKLYFRDIVLKDDVEEALRLLNASKSAISAQGASSQYNSERVKHGGASGQLWVLMSHLIAEGRTRFSTPALKESIVSHGFTEQEFDDFILDYTALGLLESDPTGNFIVAK